MHCGGVAYAASAANRAPFWCPRPAVPGTRFEGDYAAWTGTSFAAAQVTGGDRGALERGQQLPRGARETANGPCGFKSRVATTVAGNPSIAFSAAPGLISGRWQFARMP